MGWQQISSGSRYVSSSGHTFIIGGISKGIIGMVLYWKAWQIFDAADKRVEEAETCDHPKNFEGRAKIMEDGAIMKMLDD